MILIPNGNGGTIIIPTSSTSPTQRETQEVECVENCEPQQPQTWEYIVFFGGIVIIVGSFIAAIVELWRCCKND